MKTKTNPIITYTEILARAIGSIEADIQEFRCECATLPEEKREVLFEACTGELTEKLKALKTMYRIETGSDI